jgi:hypothetical protein
MSQYGVSRKQTEVKGKMEIMAKKTIEHFNQTCYVVDSLPRNLDIKLRQDWLHKAGYGFQKKSPVIIPPHFVNSS